MMIISHGKAIERRNTTKTCRIILCCITLLVTFSGCSVPEQVKTETQELLAEMLPKEANTEVTTSSNNLIISVHLLKAYSPGDDNPYVKGNYGTRESMRHLIENRSADIYRKVFTSLDIPQNVNVCINACHGVRVTYFGDYSGTSDHAMTLYQTKISGSKAAKLDWNFISNEKIVSLWKVERDIIPTLQFETVMY